MPHTWQAETGQLDNENATTQGEVLDNEQSQVQVDTVTKWNSGTTHSHIQWYTSLDGHMRFPFQKS